MTSITPLQKDRPAWTLVQRLCVAWVLAVLLIALASLTSTDNVMVMDRYVDTLSNWTVTGAAATAVCGVVLAWREHQTFELPHFGKMIAGYIVVIFGCGIIGAAAIHGGVPRLTLLASQTEMTVEAGLYKVSSGAMDRRTARRLHRRWIWNMRHPNAEIYDLQLDARSRSVFTRRQISVPDRHGLPLMPSGLSWGVPKPIQLHGTGNSFAIWVTDFTVLD